jgi:hypothetical protein
VFELAANQLHRAAERGKRTKLHIRSKPDGAWVILDAKDVGATELVRETYPGTHTILLQKNGYLDVTRRVEARQNATENVYVELPPQQANADPTRANDAEPSSTSSTRTAKIFVGAGIGGVAAGGLLLYLNESPAAHSEGVKEHYLRTRPYGIALEVASIAAIGYGAYLWIHHSNPTTVTNTPTVAPTSGGAVVGWLGSF